MWEELITTALERGYFEAETYSVSFYRDAEYIGSAEVFSVSCFSNWLQFTIKTPEGVSGRYDAVRVFKEDMPELMQDVKDGTLKEGQNIHIRFTRPLAV